VLGAEPLESERAGLEPLRWLEACRNEHESDASWSPDPAAEAASQRPGWGVAAD
jgi:hypothetical protein